MGGEQGVAAELEEVVGDTDSFNAEDEREEGREQFLGRSAGRDVFARGGDEVRCGKGLPVHLAAGIERECVEEDEDRRHHVLGQLERERRAKGLGVGSRGGRGDDVGDEVGLIADDDDGIRDRGKGAEDGLDFTQLDAEAAQLDLEVGAAEVLERPIWQPASDVASAVEARARGCTEGVGDEALSGEVGPAPVAEADLDAADEEITGDTHGRRLAGLVEDEEPRVRDGLAHGDEVSSVPREALEEGDFDGGLGGAVEVEDLRVRQSRVGAAHHLGGEGFTTACQTTDVRQRFESRLLQEGAEHRRDEVDDGDALLGDEAHEVGGVLVSTGLREDEASARDERGEELPDGDVEGEGRLLEDGVGCRQWELLLHPQQAVDDA